jgi:hypothetical protein
VAVIDGHFEHSPLEFVRRPKISDEPQTLGLDRMELGAFIAQGAAAAPSLCTTSAPHQDGFSRSFGVCTGQRM